MSEKKNPYASDTPEWQLYENMVSSEAQSRAWADDAERFRQKSGQARERAARFQTALDRLSMGERTAR